MRDSLSSTNFNKDFQSADQLADYIAEILECPITIEDSNHHLISYSKHSENIDEARISTIMSRKVPDKVINSLWKNGIMHKLFESDEPIAIPAIEEVGLGNRIAVSIRKNNEILGFIWAHTNDKALSDNKLQLLTEAAKLVKKFMLHSRTRKIKGEDAYNNFFWQLLMGDIDNDSEIKQRAEQLGIQLDGNLAIVIIEFKNDITETIERHANYLLKTLNKVQIVLRLFDQKQLILLVQGAQVDHMKQLIIAFIQSFQQKMNTQLEICCMKSSIGLIYHSAINMTNSYKQALKVMELKDKFPDTLEGIYSYQDLGIYQFIEELRNKRQQMHYENESLEKLKAYDKKHHTELLPTLKIYLECDSNVNQAAKKMFIHANTMNYRLKRIEEVSGINLKNAHLKVTAYIDLLIESFDDM